MIPAYSKPLKILVICPLSYVGSMAFVMESVELLAAHGNRVDFLVSDKGDVEINISHPNLKVIFFRRSGVNRFFQYFYLLYRSRQVCREGKYSLTIGVSQIGSLICGILKTRFRIPFIVFNDELWFGDERKSYIGNMFGVLLKRFEQIAARMARFTVTQDENRGRILSKINKISINSIRYLPNSRSGPAKYIESKYLHDKYNLTADTKIIFWMGALSPGDGALMLAEEALGWPSDIYLIFHFRSSNPSSYMLKIQHYHQKGQVIVSNNPIAYDEVSQMVSSASIGLGLYANKGANTQYMGYSSGKINAFLQAGIPTIVNNYIGLRWVQECGAGLCIEGPEQVYDAARAIFKNYDDYRRKTLYCFEKHLNFNKAFSQIEVELKSIFELAD